MLVSGSAYFYNKNVLVQIGTLPISGFMVCEVVKLDVIGIDSASQKAFFNTQSFT